MEVRGGGCATIQWREHRTATPISRRGRHAYVCPCIVTCAHLALEEEEDIVRCRPFVEERLPARKGDAAQQGEDSPPEVGIEASEEGQVADCTL